MGVQPACLTWTWAQTAAQFGGRSAQWLRQQIARNPDFATFPRPILGGMFFRAAEVARWVESWGQTGAAPEPGGMTEQERVEAELMRRAEA